MASSHTEVLRTWSLIGRDEVWQFWCHLVSVQHTNAEDSRRSVTFRLIGEYKTQQRDDTGDRNDF